MNRTLRPWGPGLDVVGCQLKDIYLIQITDEIAVSVYKVEETLEKCFALVRKIESSRWQSVTLCMEYSTWLVTD